MEILQKELIYFWIPCFWGDFLRIVPSWIFQICKMSAFCLGFCGWFLIFWHKFYTLGRSRMVNHEFSPPFGRLCVSTFFQASSRVANRSFVALDSQSSDWHVVREKLPEVNISTESTDLGKGNKSCLKKKTWRSYACFVLEVRYSYLFCSKNICHLGFPSYLFSKLGPLESKVRSIPASWRELRANESP